MEMKPRNGLSQSKNDSNEREQVYKVIVVGDSGVGKSQLIVRYTDNRFSPESEPTVMMDYTLKSLENSKIMLHIWDLAGREAFTSNTSHYKQAQGALVVYDITRVRSFEHATQWFERIRETLGCDCVIVLVGNKLDLRHQRSITTEEGHTLAKRFDASFIEASACNATNVDKCFRSLIENITERIARTDSENSAKSEERPEYEATSLTEGKHETVDEPAQPKSSLKDSLNEAKRKKKRTRKFPCCF